MAETKETGIDTPELFEDYFKTLKAKACEVFNADGHHTHLMFLVRKDGALIMTPVGVLMDSIAKQNSLDGDAGDVAADAIKEATFRVLGQLIEDQKAVGYVDICEGWAMMPSLEDGDVSGLGRQWTEAKKKYGSISKMPTRQEVLFMNGRFRNTRYTAAWKIRRPGSAVLLEVYHEGKHEITDKERQALGMSKNGMLDLAVDRVLGEEEANVE